MVPAYEEFVPFVQALAPTWRKPQHTNFARLLGAVIERPSLCLSELARALPQADQPLHGRIKRITRFLDNPHLDELALSVRWLKLTYRFGADLPDQPATAPLLPILLDTTYFHPFAALLATVPCGSRGLPLALTTYHRQELTACFPPQATWPGRYPATAPGPQRTGGRPPAASQVTPFLSQNRIEEHLIDLVWRLLSPALRGVLVADRGFARASLFQWLQERQRDFVIRIDADTHVQLQADQPSAPARDALALRPGGRVWHPQATYHKEEQVPVNLLGVWDVGQKEPWYLATGLDRADWTETCYRWRMRIECTNRDEKTGVLLREGGDDHALRNGLHLHRLLLLLCAAEWLSALIGLQAWNDLPATAPALPPATAPDGAGTETPVPVPPAVEPTGAPPAPLRPAGLAPNGTALGPGPADDAGPSQPPPVVPHRGPQPPLPRWLRRFTARGHLSYVRLGMEVLRAPDLGWILRRMLRWLADYLWLWTPRWRPWHLRYRRTHGWTIPP